MHTAWLAQCLTHSMYSINNRGDDDDDAIPGRLFGSKDFQV